MVDRNLDLEIHLEEVQLPVVENLECLVLQSLKVVVEKVLDQEFQGQDQRLLDELKVLVQLVKLKDSWVQLVGNY